MIRRKEQQRQNKLACFQLLKGFLINGGAARPRLSAENILADRQLADGHLADGQLAD
jgi:hypothetical protein